MISITTDSLIIDFLLLFLLWAIVHSMLASLTVKDILRRRLGKIYHFYRVFYVLLSSITLISLFIFIPLPQSQLYAFEGITFYLLKALQTAALIAFLFTSTSSIEDDFLGLREARKFFSAKLGNNALKPLRTDGIMGYSRHPLYFFVMVLLWSDPQMTVSWSIIAVTFTLYFLIGSIFEERKLISLYGKNYLEYKKRVRRFIPIKKLSAGVRRQRYL